MDFTSKVPTSDVIPSEKSVISEGIIVGEIGSRSKVDTELRVTVSACLH